MSKLIDEKQERENLKNTLQDAWAHAENLRQCRVHYGGDCEYKELRDKILDLQHEAEEIEMELRELDKQKAA